MGINSINKVTMTGTIVVMVVVIEGISLGREAIYYVYNIINEWLKSQIIARL